ncbi:MAG: branched-chain amino acid ABC transporter permease [Acetanaerobacterium sp.]
MLWLEQLVSGLSVGAVYALIALGYTLVFGVLRLINFAHCDVMMVGAYAGYLSSVYLKAGFILSAVIAAALCAGLGLIIERVCYRPLRGARGMPLMVVTLGVSLLLQYSVMLIFGAGARAYPSGFSGGVIHLGAVTIPSSKLAALLIGVTLTALLQLMLTKTRAGRAMRAVSDDEVAARLCGIHEQGAISLAFVLGCALAGVAGAVYGSMYLISPLMGVTPGLKAFAAAVVGGIGSVPGAVLGGFTLGMCEAFAGAAFGTASRDVASFALLIGFLLLRPGGIVGSKAGAE